MTSTQKEHVIELISALRSGKYKQGIGMLRPGDDCYCCLGVACDISKLFRWRPLDGEYVYGGVDEEDYSLLPETVMEHYGFQRECGVHIYEGEHRSLADMNDTGFSFKEIAARIEYCLNHPETGMFA
jgi:hypothetical protein